MTLSPLVQRVKELDERATPGPWRVSMSGYSVKSNSDFPEFIIAAVHGGASVTPMVLEAWITKNADFIAEARTLLPQLAAALGASQRENEILRQEANSLIEAAHDSEARYLVAQRETQAMEKRLDENVHLSFEFECSLMKIFDAMKVNSVKDALANVQGATERIKFTEDYEGVKFTLILVERELLETKQLLDKSRRETQEARAIARRLLRGSGTSNPHQTAEQVVAVIDSWSPPDTGETT